MSTLHDVAIAMDKEAKEKVADFGEDVTNPLDLGWRLKEPERISPHVEHTRKRFLEVREEVVEKLKKPGGDVSNTEDVDVTLGNKTLDLVEGVADKTIATSQGVALAGAMATQRIINKVKEVQNPPEIPTVPTPEKNIGTETQPTHKKLTDILQTISPSTQKSSSLSMDKLSYTLNKDSGAPSLTLATLKYPEDKPEVLIDVKKFGGFGSVIPAQQIKTEKQPENVALKPEVSESTHQAQENIDASESLKRLREKEGLLRAQKTFLEETILKNNQLMNSLKKTEGAVFAAVEQEKGLSAAGKEDTLKSIRERIAELEKVNILKQAELVTATKEHGDVLAQLASKQESVQTQQSETKGNTATIEASSLLFSREGLTDFQKKIADQESVAALFALLASPEYKNHQFGSGTRKESGVQLAQRISEYILQAKTGDKASPRFFIPDAIIAGKVQELLEKSFSWKKSGDKGTDIYGIDVFEKVESDPTIQDAQVGKAVAETIEKVRKETHPGWFARVGSWFKEAAKPTREKAVGVGVAGVFGSLLLALGLWAGNGQDNKKTEGAPANADNTSESAEQGPTTSKGNHSLYNPGTQESQPTTNTQEKEALKAAQDAVTKVYAEQGKVAFDEGDTKVFTGEEVADGPATEINPESAKPRNLMDRIANPLDRGIGDIRIANGTVYVEPRGQVVYIEAPTPKTSWAQAVINDALNYNVQSRNGTMDAGKANQWAKGHLRNVFEMYERRNTEMRMTGESYTNQEALFLRSAFVELQKKIASVAQGTKTLSHELEKVTSTIEGIDLGLSGQY